MPEGTEFTFWRPGDILILILIIVSVILLSGRNSDGEAGTATVVVASEGEVTVPLDGDSTLTVEGYLGEMILRTERGRIRVESSPCPGQHCVAMGWAAVSGDAIICIPSGIYVRLDPSDDDGVDAVTY